MMTTYNVCIFFWGTVDYLSVSLASCELYGYKKVLKALKMCVMPPVLRLVWGQDQILGNLNIYSESYLFFSIMSR